MSPISKKTPPRRVTVGREKNVVPVVKKFSPRSVKSVEAKPSKPVSPPNPSLRLYRRIAGGFIAIVVILLITVILLSTTKATVRITPQPRTVEASLLIDVVKEGTADGKILGLVVEQTFEQAKTFPVIGSEQKEVLDKAGGTVKIINNSSRTQPLVATTRLLSSGGVLFRLDKGVTVPAGGSVEAIVHADQVGSTGDINPDKFIIPGLSTSLQSSIYGESSTAMTGGRRMVSVVSQAELDNNAAELLIETENFAKEQLGLQSKAGWTSEIFSTEIISKVSDTEPGEEKDSVIISLKMKVVGVFFNDSSIDSLVDSKLYENLEAGFVFSKAEDADSIDTILEIVSSNAGKNEAELRVTTSKKSVVSNTNAFLQPEALAGKTPNEVKDYLVSAGLAKDVSVTIFPPWIGKVPSMLDQVTVQVVE